MPIIHTNLAMTLCVPTYHAIGGKHGQRAPSHVSLNKKKIKNKNILVGTIKSENYHSM